MDLRPAGDADLTIVISWIKTADDCLTWAGPAVSYPIELNELKRQIEFSADNSFCLIDKTQRVAFGQLLQKGIGHYHLARIIVAPSLRGQQYGRRVCEDLIKKAQEFESRLLTLNVYQDNHRAIGLYRYLGFNPAPAPGTIQVPAGVLHMRWEEK